MFIDEDIINERLNSRENLLYEIDKLLKEDSPSNDSESKEQESHKELNDKEAMKLLDRALNPEDYKNQKRGRGRELNYEERADIGVLATVTSTYQAAEMLGISTGQTAVYRQGKTNFYDDHESPTLQKRLRSKLDEIAECSANRLLEIVGVIDDEAIENLRSNALKATQVGVNLARIIDKVKPQSTEDNGPKAVFVIMQPQLAKEEDYGDVINVT